MPRRICLLAVTVLVALVTITIPVAALHAEDAWTRLDGPLLPGGHVYDLAVAPSHPRRLYAVVSHPQGLRLFRSDDGAANWYMPTGTFLPVPGGMASVAVDPSDADRLFVATGGGVFRSVDGGVSWEMVSSISGYVAMPASDHLYVVGRLPDQEESSCQEPWTFAHSADGGESWVQTELPCVREVVSLNSPSDSPNLILLGVETLDRGITLLRSTDGGQSWSDTNLRLLFRYRSRDVAFDPRDGLIVYAFNHRTLYKSSDGGQSWQSWTFTVPLDADFTQLTVDPEGQLYLAAKEVTVTSPSSYTSMLRIYRSEDGGLSWWRSQQTFPETWATDLVVAPDQPERLYLGLSEAGIWRSDNRGGLWQESNQGIETPAWISQLAAVPQSSILYAAARSGGFSRTGLFRSEDNGETWTQVLLDVPVMGIAVAAQGEQELVLATTVQGQLYSLQRQGTPGGEQVRAIEPLNMVVRDVAISVQDPGVRLLGGWRSLGEYQREGQIALWQSGGEGYGSYWRTQVLTGTREVLFVDIHPDNPRIMVAAGLDEHGSDVIFLSTDGGQSWDELFRGEVDIPFQCRYLDVQLSRGSVYMLCPVYPIYTTPLSERMWSPWLAGLQGDPSALVLLAEDSPILGTHDGVWWWRRDQRQWELLGLADQWVTALEIGGSEGEWLFAGNALGVWRHPLPTVPPIQLYLPAVGQEASLRH